MRTFIITAPSASGANNPIGDCDRLADAVRVSRLRTCEIIDVWLNGYYDQAHDVWSRKRYFVGSLLGGVWA